MLNIGPLWQHILGLIPSDRRVVLQARIKIGCYVFRRVVARDVGGRVARWTLLR